MPLQLLDGTDASVDLLLTWPSGTVGSSLRCITTDIEWNEVRAFQGAETLCSLQYADELPGKRQSFITIGKLQSRGQIISDFSPLMSMTQAAAVALTFFTGCTKIGTYWMSDDRARILAGIVVMPGQSVLRSKGSWSTAWVIT